MSKENNKSGSPAARLQRENEELRKQLEALAKEHELLKSQIASADTGERVVSRQGAPLVIGPAELVGITRAIK